MHEPYYREAASAGRPRFNAKSEGFEKRDGEVRVPVSELSRRRHAFKNCNVDEASKERRFP